MANYKSITSKNVYWKMHEPHGRGDLIIKLPIFAKEDLLLSWKALSVASILREGYLRMTLRPSSCLPFWGAKSHSVANLGRPLWKAKDLFSYIKSYLILQQIQKAFCRKLRTHSHIPGPVSFYRKYEKFFKKLKTHLVVSHAGGAKAHSATNLESLPQSA